MTRTAITDLSDNLSGDKPPRWELLAGVGQETVGEVFEQNSTGHATVKTDEAPRLASVHDVTLGAVKSNA